MDIEDIKRWANKKRFTQAEKNVIFAECDSNGIHIENTQCSNCVYDALFALIRLKDTKQAVPPMGACVGGYKVRKRYLELGIVGTRGGVLDLCRFTEHTLQYLRANGLLDIVCEHCDDTSAEE